VNAKKRLPLTEQAREAWTPTLHGSGPLRCPERASVEPGQGQYRSALSKGRPGLIQLVREWDKRRAPLCTDVILQALEDLDVDREALEGCINFSELSYQRTTIHCAECYEVLVLCWRSGQGSPIHDHGESTCGVLILEGTATETSFAASSSGRWVPARLRRLKQGSTIVSCGSDVHQLANLEPPGVDLISLHVYSPPLSNCRCYRVAETALYENDSLIDNAPVTRTARL
jgi:cysteine dioxygenase